MSGFHSFHLHPHLQAALDGAGFTAPTPVQQQAIPAAMQGRDVLASAQTGTGKTAAFVLPALQRLLTLPVPNKGHGPRLLVLTPTRELATQVAETARLFGKPSGMRVGVVVGGVSYGPQFRLLAERLDVLVATPGRLIDHLTQGKVDFSRVEVLVLDEADRMLDMGFLKPVERIMAALPKKPQTLLFTATLTPAVHKVAARVLTQPHTVTLAPAKPKHELITQRAYRADSQEHKLAMLLSLLADPEVDQMIIFAATKHGSDKLAAKLKAAGHASAALHGGMSQNARKRTLDQVHKGSVKLLVATDVAARGLDVKELGHVVNFDLPQVAEDYVHRIGRTGRQGAKGAAISLIAPSDVPMLRDIEKLLGTRMPLAQMAGHESLLEEVEFNRLGAAAPRSRQKPKPPRHQAGGGATGGAQAQPARSASERSQDRHHGRPQRLGGGGARPAAGNGRRERRPRFR